MVLEILVKTTFWQKYVGVLKVLFNVHKGPELCLMCVITSVTMQIKFKTKVNTVDSNWYRRNANHWTKWMEKDGKCVQRDAYVQLICYYFIKGTLNFTSVSLPALLLLLVICFAEDKWTVFYTQCNKIHASSSHTVISC
jgi:hypothetical protein